MQTLQKDDPLKKGPAYQPGESYLPSQCRELPDENRNFQQSPALTAQGGYFYKQREITNKNSVHYEQNLGHEKKIWSVTRQKNTLEYRNKKESSWSSKTVSLEVARAQILDVMNRFADSVVTININHCNKESERNYRLVIRAYNEKNTGRQIACAENKNIKMKSTKLDQELTKQHAIFNLQSKATHSSINKIQETTLNDISVRMR